MNINNVFFKIANKFLLLFFSQLSLKPGALLVPLLRANDRPVMFKKSPRWHCFCHYFSDVNSRLLFRHFISIKQHVKFLIFYVTFVKK